jgi:hypothetical protein
MTPPSWIVIVSSPSSSSTKYADRKGLAIDLLPASLGLLFSEDAAEFATGEKLVLDVVSTAAASTSLTSVSTANCTAGMFWRYGGAPRGKVMVATTGSSPQILHVRTPLVKPYGTDVGVDDEGIDDMPGYTSLMGYVHFDVPFGLKTSNVAVYECV